MAGHKFHIRRHIIIDSLVHFVHCIIIYEITSIDPPAESPLSQLSSFATDALNIDFVEVFKFEVNTGWLKFASDDSLMAVWFNMATIATLKFTFNPYTIAMATEPKIARIYRAGSTPEKRKKRKKKEISFYPRVLTETIWMLHSYFPDSHIRDASFTHATF